MSSMPVGTRKRVQILFLFWMKTFKRSLLTNNQEIKFLKDNTIVYETPEDRRWSIWAYAGVYKQDALLVTTDELRNHIHTINGNFLLWKKYNRVTVSQTDKRQKLLWICLFNMKLNHLWIIRWTS